ncbi:MAG: hypothetical protein MZV70_12595 [Desulfobacterales bacterium]|nr:hypothetical protein [Desulfobacterales bacterium]
MTVGHLHDFRDFFGRLGGHDPIGQGRFESPVEPHVGTPKVFDSIGDSSALWQVMFSAPTTSANSFLIMSNKKSLPIEVILPSAVLQRDLKRFWNIADAVIILRAAMV